MNTALNQRMYVSECFVVFIQLVRTLGLVKSCSPEVMQRLAEKCKGSGMVARLEIIIYLRIHNYYILLLLFDTASLFCRECKIILNAMKKVYTCTIHLYQMELTCIHSISDGINVWYIYIPFSWHSGDHTTFVL